MTFQRAFHHRRGPVANINCGPWPPLSPAEMVTTSDLRRLARHTIDRDMGDLALPHQQIATVILADLCRQLLAHRAIGDPGRRAEAVTDQHLRDLARAQGVRGFVKTFLAMNVGDMARELLGHRGQEYAN